MNPIQQIRSKMLHVVKRHDVIRAAFFGSFARGEQAETSDLARAFMPQASAWGLGSPTEIVAGASSRGQGARILPPHAKAWGIRRRRQTGRGHATGFSLWWGPPPREQCLPTKVGANVSPAPTLVGSPLPKGYPDDHARRPKASSHD